jgi:hypothetical protein
MPERAGDDVSDKVPEAPPAYSNFVLTCDFVQGENRQTIAFYMLRCGVCWALVSPEDYYDHNAWHDRIGIIQ